MIGHSRRLLGCIADDFTGATDLANNLVRAGTRVVQTVGVPQGDWGMRTVKKPAHWSSGPWPRVARALVELGVRQLVVAGGETSGACVQALGIGQMQIGPQIDPGVPWCHAPTAAGAPIHLALKSGNFGSDDFFTKAFRMPS